MNISLLSTEVQKSIWKMGWKGFTPIQEAAIEKIITTDHNYILVSSTASGKTEAVFLPTLSMVDWRKKGILILYISPLRALINDQSVRIKNLCRYLKCPVNKWHSDVHAYQKEKILKDPQGILQITPESIEAFLIHHSEQVRPVFQNLEFIIIDELHNLMGRSRGIQLQSLLERLRKGYSINPRIISLSATIDDLSLAKPFMSEKRKTFVIKIKDKRPLKYHLKHFTGTNIHPDLVWDIYQLSQKYRTLIFANSRRLVEEISIKLKKMATEKGGHLHYFSHHSSLIMKDREFIEKTLRKEETPVGICCTSTLELGIDIGTMDLIIQIDATSSVSTLIQRLGRSGRREGIPRMLQVYTTDTWNLLQAIACIELLREGFMDNQGENYYPIDVLFQQILSILMERRGLKKKELLFLLEGNHAFQKIPKEEIEFLISSMITSRYIQDLRQEMILGHKGEKFLITQKIYTTFNSFQNLHVYYREEEIGNIPFYFQIEKGNTIFLGTKIWKIITLDLEKKRVHVIPSEDGVPVLFFSQPQIIHQRIKEKMLEILYEEDALPYIDGKAKDSLQILKEYFHQIPLDIRRERPYFKTLTNYNLYTFTSSRINHTLLTALSIRLEKKVEYEQLKNRFIFKSSDSLPEVMDDLGVLIKNSDSIMQMIDPLKYNLPYWASFLPSYLKKRWLYYNYFDFPGTREYLKTFTFQGTFGEDLE